MRRAGAAAVFGYQYISTQLLRVHADWQSLSLVSEDICGNERVAFSPSSFERRLQRRPCRRLREIGEFTSQECGRTRDMEQV